MDQNSNFQQLAQGCAFLYRWSRRSRYPMIHGLVLDQDQIIPIMLISIAQCLCLASAWSIQPPFTTIIVRCRGETNRQWTVSACNDITGWNTPGRLCFMGTFCKIVWAVWQGRLHSPHSFITACISARPCQKHIVLQNRWMQTGDKMEGNVLRISLLNASWIG